MNGDMPEEIEHALTEDEAKPSGESFWLVPYVNMMTILMIFFLALYAFSKLNKDKIKKVTNSIYESMSAHAELKEDFKRLGLLGEFRQFVWNNQLQQYVEISSDARRIHISMQLPVLFNAGSTTIKPEGQIILDKLGALIKSEVGDVRVAGFTDNTPVRSGKVQDNWELAGKRAYQVVKYWIDKHEITPFRFSIYSYGEYAPVVANTTEENKALNRRIEISIIKKKKLWAEQ